MIWTRRQYPAAPPNYFRLKLPNRAFFHARSSGRRASHEENTLLNSFIAEIRIENTTLAAFITEIGRDAALKKAA